MLLKNTDQSRIALCLKLSCHLEGFSLTTAEIIYRLPDHPRLLQSYIWQDYDLAPKFPKLADFLARRPLCDYLLATNCPAPGRGEHSQSKFISPPKVA
jgi:Usg-like family protein